MNCINKLLQNKQNLHFYAIPFVGQPLCPSRRQRRLWPLFRLFSPASHNALLPIQLAMMSARCVLAFWRNCFSFFFPRFSSQHPCHSPRPSSGTWYQAAAAMPVSFAAHYTAACLQPRFVWSWLSAGFPRLGSKLPAPSTQFSSLGSVCFVNRSCKVCNKFG